MKFYRCKVCGNLVELINVGGGELVCCGEAMEKLKPKTGDEGREKHVPVVSREGNKVIVEVGSIPHPMLKEHHIEWIIIAYHNNVQRAKLKYTDKPTATFIVDENTDRIEVYEHCNIHGLWKTTYKA